VQLIVDLLSRAAYRTQSFDQNFARRAELIQTLKLVGSAIQVVAGQAAGKEPIAAAAQPVAKLDSNASTANNIKAVDELITVIVANFADVKKPDPSFVKLS
jgi:hypothetical protein